MILNFIKQRECLNGKPNIMAYKDSANIWTIGYGQNLFYTSDLIRIKNNSSYKYAEKITDLPKEYQVWDLEKCELEFNKHVLDKINILKKYNFDKVLTEFQFGALLDFTFQFGERTEFLNYIKNNYTDDLKIINKFFEWSKVSVNGVLTLSKGILMRRKLELIQLWFISNQAGINLTEAVYKQLIK